MIRRFLLSGVLSTAMAFVVLATEPLKKGESYGGGTVAYLIPAAKNINKTQGQHGVIAATTDLPTAMTWPEAKAACDSLSLNGYTDWVMPDKDDLNRLYLGKEILGEFMTTDYWSSSANEPDSAWSQRFLDGQKSVRSWTNHFRVRPIRKF